MGDNPAERLLTAVRDHVFAKRVIAGEQNSCIQGSAILMKVLHGVGFPVAYPLTVGVQIHNAAYLKWVEKYGEPEIEQEIQACNDAGAATAVIGKHPQCVGDENNWATHLTIVVPKVFGADHSLLDLTVEQATRPEYGIFVQNPIHLRVPE